MAKDLDFAVGQGEAFDGLVAHVGLDASSKASPAVSRLVKLWENRQAQQAARIGGLGLVAISLAACNVTAEVEPVDTDGDGVVDSADAFPNDASETNDTDGDGIGDNADFYPNDPTRWNEVTQDTLTSGLDTINEPAITVYGGNLTLTSGDRITAQRLELDLRAIDIDGQTVTADVIAIDASGGVTIEASDWTVDTIEVFDSTGNVTVNDIQSAGTNLVISDMVSPTSTATFNFDAQATTGATVVDISVAEVTAAVALTGGAIETVNLTIADAATNAVSTLADFTATGNTTLNINGGTAGFGFAITAALDAGLTRVNASEAASNLSLNITSSTTAIRVDLGRGNDTLATGDTMGDLDEQDTFTDAGGNDTLTAVFSTAGTRNPISSDIETFTLTFNNSATVDFTHVDDVQTINVLESTYRAQLIDMDNSVTAINLRDSQAGSWDVDYESGEDATLAFTWTNNDAATRTISTIVFDEVKSLTVTANGTDDIVFGSSHSGEDFAVDDDDTESLTFQVTSNGDMTVYGIETSSAVETLTVTTSSTGDLTIDDTAGAMLEAEALTRYHVSASSAGTINVGVIGAVATSADQLELWTVTSEGANIVQGNVVATNATISQYLINMAADSDYGSGTLAVQDISELRITVEQDAEVDLGAITMSQQGDTLVTSGEGTVDQLVFGAEAFATMTFRHTGDGQANDGIELDYHLATGDTTLSTTSDEDMLWLGAGDNTVETGAGDDGVEVIVTSTASNRIDTGAGVDVIVLATASGDDVVQPGGTAVSTTGVLGSFDWSGATALGGSPTVDTVVNFAAGDDHIALHTVAGSSANYAEATAADYATALVNADIAMNGTVIYYLAQVSTTHAYLFADTDTDGDADLVVGIAGNQLASFGFDEIVALVDFIA